MTDVWTHVAAERRTLADFLETLEHSDWDERSLCTDWAIRDVVAHVAWGPGEPARERVASFLRGGFRINRISAEHARRWGRSDPAVMIARLREIADDHRSPIGVTGRHVLADILCHDLDIRRPLGRPRPMPPEPFRLTADLMAGIGWPLHAVFARSPRRTVNGLRLVADDLHWWHGSGPEVHGSAEALLLAITGRPVGPDELTGPGAPAIYARLT